MLVMVRYTTLKCPKSVIIYHLRQCRFAPTPVSGVHYGLYAQLTSITCSSSINGHLCTAWSIIRPKFLNTWLIIISQTYISGNLLVWSTRRKPYIPPIAPPWVPSNGRSYQQADSSSYSSDKGEIPGWSPAHRFVPAMRTVNTTTAHSFLPAHVLRPDRPDHS